MPVGTVLPCYDCRAQTYVCLAIGSNNIRVVGHLQFRRTDYFLCPTTDARNVISFQLNEEYFISRYVLIFIYCKQVNTCIDTSKEFAEKDDYYSVIAAL